MAESKKLDSETKVQQEKDVEHGGQGVLDGEDASSLGKGDILSREHTDPVLNAKMHLINNVSVDFHYGRKCVARSREFDRKRKRKAAH